MTTTNELTTAAPKSTALAVKGWLEGEAMQTALRSALTGYMDERTFAAQCYLAAQDVKLSQCSAGSLFKAFLQCAQMGLLPGKHHGHVALVPRGGEITVVPQWQGFKFLMERQPGVRRVTPVLVHKRDAFHLVNGDPSHEFDPFDDARVFEHPDLAAKAGRECGLRGGYLRIDRDDGTVEFHFVSSAKIERNRKCAETQTIWQKWFEEMCMKTVLRDAWSKRIISIDPELGERVGRVSATDDAAMGNDPSRGDAPVSAPVKVGKIDAIRARLAPRTAPPVDVAPETAAEDDDEPPPPAKASKPEAPPVDVDGTHEESTGGDGPVNTAAEFATDDEFAEHLASLPNEFAVRESWRKRAGDYVGEEWTSRYALVKADLARRGVANPNGFVTSKADRAA